MGESGEASKTDKAKAIDDALQGIGALGEHLRNYKVTDIGVGVPEPLPEPITDSFGTFRERKKYISGCNLSKILENQGHVVTFNAEDDESVRNVEIGRVPREFDPTQGGKAIREAGQPNDYLLSVKTTNKATKGSRLSFRYLDKSEIDDVVIEKGKEASFKPHANGTRQVVLRGTISSVSTLR